MARGLALGFGFHWGWIATFAAASRANASAGASRSIPDRYALIAVQISSGCGMWNNPTWSEVVAHLKMRGLRRVGINEKPVHGSGPPRTQIPRGAEGETRDRPLAERGRWLKRADVFVGRSRSLAWLAWSVGTPTMHQRVRPTGQRVRHALAADELKRLQRPRGRPKLTDGTHTASITLLGLYIAAGFSGSAAAAGFAAVLDGGAGTRLTYTPIAGPH